MKVCLDIQAARGQRAGVGRYVRELLWHLGPAANGDEITAFYFDFRRAGAEPAPPGVNMKCCRWLPGRVVQGAWKRWGFPPYDWLAGPADLYHFPNFIRPPLSAGRRAVVTIHDVSFLRMPETTEEKNLAWLTAEIRRTVETAQAILTDSHFSAREIVELLRVPPEKVYPVWLGLPELGPPLSAAEASQLRTAMGLHRPYLLMVGTLEPRKNIPFLVRIYEALGDFDGDLVIAGGLGWKTGPTLTAISCSRRREEIKVIQHLDDRRLAALYGGAAAFVYPTLYEGFGFPPLEALAHGMPVIAARHSSLPEVLGEAAVWVEGFDVEAWAAVLRDLLADPVRRAQLREKGIAQARKFTWAETARQTWAVYRRVAG